MGDQKKIEIIVKEIKYENASKWEVLAEFNVSIPVATTVENSHAILCYAFDKTKNENRSKLFTLNDKKELALQGPDEALKDGETYYVVFTEKPNSSGYKRDQKSTDLRSLVKQALDNWANCKSTALLIESIDRYIEQSSLQLDALVNQNLLPAKPYKYQLPGFKETLYATISEGSSSPNLLIHELNKAKNEVMAIRKKKIQDLYKNVINSYVSVMMGPSGCGKTRTIFEFLTDHFGIFITASTALNGGSDDLQLLLEKVKQEMPPLIRSIQLFYGFQSIVAIRLIFLQRLQLKYGTLTPYHWLIIQEMPKEIFKDIDVFSKLNEDFKVNIDSIDSVEGCRMPVFLDESQAVMYPNNSNSMMCCSGSSIVALARELNSKPDSENTETSDVSVTRIPIDRKLVSPILHSFTKLLDKNLTFVISGTGLQFDEFEESLASTVAKRVLKEPRYIKLGSFMEFEPFEQYIRHYLPGLSDSDLRTIHESVRGRYRFTARFIVYYLQYRHVETALEHTNQHVALSILKSLQSKFPEENKFFKKFKCLLEMMFKRFWSGESTDIFGIFDSTDDAWLIEYGLGLIRPMNGYLELFDTYPSVLRCIQVVEPLAFEAIHSLLIPSNQTIKTQYINHALHNFVKSSSTDPSQLGFLIESPAALQFLNLVESGRLPGKLKEELKGYNLLEKRTGRPFSLRGEVGKYTLLDFLSQDFWSENGYKYVAITSELRKKVADLAFIAKKSNQPINAETDLVLVMLAFKYGQTNRRSDWHSLDYDKVYTSKNKPHTEENRLFNTRLKRFSKCIRVLIQLGNEREYNDPPKWLHILRVNDLQFNKVQKTQITTHLDRTPNFDQRRTEDTE